MSQTHAPKHNFFLSNFENNIKTFGVAAKAGPFSIKHDYFTATKQ